LNDTIWVLKKDSLNLTAISDRIKVFIGQIRKSYPAIQLEVEENIIKDHLLSSAQAFHLYRILQEGINNSLKHSKGKNIRVLFEASDSWSVKVGDDGVGMTADPVKGWYGNGLVNMKERSREAGWQINWHATDGQGTSMEVAPTTN
jgi:signal transduction histidine kinase